MLISNKINNKILFLLVSMVFGLFTQATFADDIHDLIKKANKGDAAAQFELGLAYSIQDDADLQSDYKIPIDSKQAFKWFAKSAKQGDIRAEYKLSVAYGDGRGINKDSIKEMYWLRKSAEQGYGIAQAGLGEKYYNGEGVKKSIIIAYQWISLALESANFNAEDELLRIKNEMTPEQIAEAEKLVSEWKDKHEKKK